MAFLDFLSNKKQKDQTLRPTKEEGFLAKISKVFSGKAGIDSTLLEELESVLISSDIGTGTTFKILDAVEEKINTKKNVSAPEVYEILKNELSEVLTKSHTNKTTTFSDYLSDKKPFIILVVGVNGVGKTTTIGKLAHQFKVAGKNVLLGAADTFRAAAVEQLTLWAERTQTSIVKQAMGADPGAVAFDTLQAAVARKVDVAIIDTAGRLHNKANLMNELSKIKKVMNKVLPDAPHEVLLVLDGSTGQNAIEQAKQFTEATNVTGIALTKLDGTAKGGVVIAIADTFNIPIKFIGVGEKMEDLKIFNSTDFIENLFKQQTA